MISSLEEFIPTKSINYVSSLIEKENIQFKIVKVRRSKHGDFKRTINGNYIITINRFYNKYRFILTLITIPLIQFAVCIAGSDVYQ